MIENYCTLAPLNAIFRKAGRAVGQLEGSTRKGKNGSKIRKIVKYFEGRGGPCYSVPGEIIAKLSE